MAVRFTTAAAIVHELMEARDERQLLRLQKQLVKQKLLIIDELGFVPLCKTGAELLFELISQRYERGSILITSNLLSVCRSVKYGFYSRSGSWFSTKSVFPLPDGVRELTGQNVIREVSSMHLQQVMTGLIRLRPEGR